MSFIVTKSFIYSSIFTLIYNITNFGSMYKEHYLGKFDNKAFRFFVTEVQLVLYTGESGLQGLNESVTSAIYHMARYIEYIHRQTISKHHAYIVSTTQLTRVLN
jgi:hypothetical protein